MNTFFFSTSDIETLSKKQNILFYIILAIIKAFELIFITKILRFFIEIFLTDKYTIKEIIKLEKDNEKNLRNETLKLIKRTKVKYIIFIILNILITILSWCFVSSFNYAYPNTKFYYFMVCIFIIIFEQLISISLVLVEACLRFISFKCKIKAIFTLSRYINDIN